MEDKNGKKIPPIELKKISGVHNLEPATINAILSASAYWIDNFYNESSGNKKVKCDFAVEGLNYGGIFDLSTARDIIEGIAPTVGRVPYLFLSDLLSFIEQIRTELASSRKISLNRNQRDELDRLGNTFGWIGIYPRNNRIEIEDLQKIENEYLSETIVKRVKLIHLILAPSIGAETIEPKRVEEPEQGGGEAAQSDEAAPLIPVPVGGGGGGNETDMGGAEEAQTTDNQTPQQQPDESQRRRPDDPNQPTPPPPSDQPFRLANLDPQAKLYLQSLSIITINQALSRYFNDASLTEMGLAPGTRVTFDHLPLKIRQELMDRAFLQVETLMLGGQFTLQDLIEKPSARINFANQSALNLLIDVRGLRLLNQAVSQLVKDKKDNQPAFEKELKKNEQQKLNEKKLSKRVKNQLNVTDTKSAEAAIAAVHSDKDLANLVEKQFNTGDNERQLDDILWQEIESIIGAHDAVNKERIINNARSLIEVFIQQGLPPEYFISDPKNFGYNNFIRIFGNDLGGKDYQQHKEKLANLIIFYWKRKRAIWAREIRQEFAQEKYTPEEAERLAKTGGQAKANKQGELRKLINVHGGRQVAQVLADPDSDAAKNNPELAAFLQQEQELIGRQLMAELAKIKPEERQVVLQTYFEYYVPGMIVAEYSEAIFFKEIAPKISPFDDYLIRGNLAMGDGAFTRDRNGLIQQAFAQLPGGAQGDDLIQNDFTRKALEWGIRAGVGAATGGASEAAFKALETAEAADPTGTVKAFKDQFLNQIIDFLKKYWPYLLALIALATLGPLIAALIAGLTLGRSLFGGGVGSSSQKLLGGREAGQNFGLTGREAFDQFSQGSAGAVPTVHTTAPAQSLVSQLASPAMIVAGQAVVATAGASLFFMYMYQANLNSAFLVDFPFSETGLTGNTDNNKESKYAEMSKTAKITRGCFFTENNGSKCENPNFPLSIEYTITIAPKEDFSIQITNIHDEMKFKQSKKGWEEAGKTPPTIPTQKDLDFNYFKELIRKQGGLTSQPLSVTPTPLPGEEEPSPTPSGAPLPSGEIVIPAGSSLTFTYTLDDLSDSYNHTAIQNTIEVNFYYQNAFLSGTDNLITSARVCLGECSGEIGCWPMSATITTLPFQPNSSHNYINENGQRVWLDAYDMANGSKQDAYGEPVYAPFDGEFCHVGCTDARKKEGYGCYNTLEFEADGSSYFMLFAHFQDPPDGMSAQDCKIVEAGFPMGLSGNRGNSTANHLHFSVARTEKQGYSSDPGVSILESLMPPDDENNQPAKLLKHVTSCYDQ